MSKVFGFLEIYVLIKLVLHMKFKKKVMKTLKCVWAMTMQFYGEI